MATTASIAQFRPQEEDGSALLQRLLAQPGRFDPDAWHVMQERDSALIRDELLHGVASNAFVYSFPIQGKTVTGISVVGARELASQYKGIKARIVATIEKRGALFIFRTFTPLSIETRVLHELSAEDDFYECVMEVSDIKSGNSIEVRKKENSTEKKRDGSTFARPHFDVICESKAFRNGVLSVLPQSVIREFRDRCLKAGQVSNEQTIQQRRAAASEFAAKHGIALDRQALDSLSFAELDGLRGGAAGGVEDFRRSAMALGLLNATAGADPETGEIPRPKRHPAMGDIDLEKMLPALAKLVADGKKTAKDLVAMLTTRHSLSDEQTARILSLKKADTPPPAVDPNADWSADYDAAEGDGK